MPISRTRSSLGLAVAMVAGALVVLGVVIIAVNAATRIHEPWWTVPVVCVVGWVYAGAGTLAWWLRPTNATGPLMVVGSFTVLLPLLTGAGVGLLTAVALLTGTLILAVDMHLLLAFPSGKLRGRTDRAMVAVAYFVAVILQAPHYLFADFPGNPLAIRDDPDLVETMAEVQSWFGAGLIAAVCTLLAVRLHRADQHRRRILTPVYLFGVVAICYITFSVRIIRPLGILTDLQLATTQYLMLGLIPVAFTIGVLAGRFSRSGEIEELGEWLAHSTDARQRLTPALARTLGDESLQMLFWAAELGGYVLPDGTRAELPTAGTGRGVVEFEVEARRVGAVVYDELLIADAEPVKAAGRVAAIALAHERLARELRASEEEVRRSRLRIVEAADQERRRIARNLHDGLQVRLVLLALDAQQVADDHAVQEATRAAAVALRERIDEAAGELRVLVHDVMPAALIERGLSAATEDLLDRVPLHTRLDVAVDEDDKTMPGPVESTAYFVVAEALTNAMKHAAATRVDVRIARSDHVLRVEVIDDGRGGATAGAGIGLRSLIDRIDTLGGRFSIDSPPGAGTTIVVELPCG